MLQRIAARSRDWVARLMGVVLCASGLVALTVGGAPEPARAMVPATPCAPHAESEAAALAIAWRCKHSVPVGPSRTEFTQVLATADGRLVFESAVVPQRARTADGAWADIDLTLVRSAGKWRPRVSVADVVFSGGGSGALVKLTREGKVFTLSWPAPLPAPAVAGDTATYPNVMPDVDLVVRATRTGFTHVLVVRTAAGAANPALRTVRFHTGGATVKRLEGGGLQAMAGSTVVASAAPALMWDSTSLSEPDASVTRSSARGAGDLAKVRPLGVDVEATGFALRPDESLLRSESARFPLYVDPAWSAGDGPGQRWAYATDNGETNTDYSTARVGKSPGTSAVYRSFFEFPTTGTNGVSLQGKHIESAYVQMNLTHSHACDNVWNYLYQTPPINATMKASWNAMALYAPGLAAQQGHANEAGGCTVIQPNMTMNYASSGITYLLQVAANNNWSAVTFGFAARDEYGGGESTIDRWMKFIPEDAKLIVDYDSKPTAPHSLQVSGVACPGAGVLTVGTLTPNLSAVHPDADGGQTLAGYYEWIEVPAGGIGAVTDTSPTRLSPPPIVPVTAGGRITTAVLPNVAKGKTYAYRAKSLDPPPYGQVSPWSAWCQFKVDDTVPPVTVSIVSAPMGPGRPGTFTISSTATDVTKFKWGWGAATTEVTATGTNPRTASITVTAPKYGKNILYVSAVDSTLNEGFGSKEFVVGRPSPAIAQWGLETYPGTDQTAALADQQPSLAGNTALSATNLTWTTDVRLMAGQTAKWNGASSQAVTAAPVLDTLGTFSIAAWAKLDQIGLATRTIVSQDGTQMSGFRLQYRADDNKWCFVMRSADDIASGITRACAQTPVAGQWAHLAGVADRTSGLIRLFVNGQLVAETPLSGGFAAAGPTAVGRAWHLGSPAETWLGQIAQVQLFDRALVDQDFTGLLASDPMSGGFNEPGILSPVQVGDWDFGSAVPCYVTDLKDTCESPDRTGFSRWIALSRGSSIGSGRATSDTGLWLDSSYFPEEGNTETGTTEYGRTAYKTGSTPPNGDGQEFTTWQDAPVLRTDQPFTISVWARVSRADIAQAVLSQDGVSSDSGFVLYYAPEDGGSWKFKLKASLTAADESDTTWAIAAAPNADQHWQHLVVVVNPQTRRVSIYVNGVLKNRAWADTEWIPWQSNGPLSLGRAKQGGTFGTWFYGGLDDMRIFQGAMSDAAVLTFHQSLIG